MLAEKMQCTGCGSCSIVCSKKCISMEYNWKGFLHPVIDNKLCVSCKSCEKVCPVLSKSPSNNSTVFWAAKNTDAIVRESSSSGGVFSALVKYCLKLGGTVCAAMYDEDFGVVHEVSNNLRTIGKFQGAKYAQSYAASYFQYIEQLLNENQWVLFVGTPCQVAGLKSFLGKEYNQLILVDMICHGVPSPMVWKQYIRELENKYSSKLININLRSKETGWSNYQYSVKFSFENGYEETQLQSENLYMRGFVNNLYLRDSCSNCSFKGINRVSDFTLGDYWGIWNQYPDFDDNYGVSLIMLHSKKANDIWNELRENFDCIPVTEKATIDNPSVYVSSIAHPNQEKFWELINQNTSIDEAISVCLGVNAEKKTLFRRLKKRIFG